MFNINTFDVKKFDSILDRGLSIGKGDPNGQMCIEAAICSTLGLPHGDDPKCVAKAVRSFKISLNDIYWSSPKARAKGLRDLGLAQLGSLGIVDDKEFATKLAYKTISVLLPKFVRDTYPKNNTYLKAALNCEQLGDKQAALDLRDLFRADAAAADAAASAAADAAYADAAAYAYVTYAAARDTYLILVASLALEVLQELKSPGCQLL